VAGQGTASPLFQHDSGTGLKAAGKADAEACVVLFSYQNKELGMKDILGLVRNYYPTHPQPSEPETAFMNFAVPP